MVVLFHTKVLLVVSIDLAWGAALPNRLLISALLIISIVVWGVVLWIRGVELSRDHLIPYSITLTVLTVSIWLFDKHVWKFRFVRLLFNRPNLNGTWRVKLQSTYRDAKTMNLAKPIEGFAVIRQNFSSISIRLMTEQADSVLIAGDIEAHPDGTCYFVGVYRNDPQISFRGDASAIHYGSFKYKIIGRPVYAMSGHYWTDRKTNGSIDLYQRVPKLFDSYDEAKNNLIVQA